MLYYTPTWGVIELYYAGQYRLEVALDGRPLAGSPFPLPVRCDETSAAACKLFGVGLTHAVAGERTSFGIQGAGLHQSLTCTLALILVPGQGLAEPV